MMRTAMLLAVLTLCSAWAGAAPLTLDAPWSETSDAGVLADSLTLLHVFAVMGLADRQVTQLSENLEEFRTAKIASDEAEARALLQARQALSAKREALLAGQPVPDNVEDQLADAMLASVRAKTARLRAETQVVRSFVRTLNDDQKLMVSWEFDGPDAAEMAAILDAYREEAARRFDAVVQVYERPIGNLLTLGANVYQRQRLGFIDDLLLAGRRGDYTQRGVYTDEEEALRMRLIELFDRWRADLYNQFPAPLPPEVLDDVIPRVTADVLAVLGVEIPSTEPPGSLITETELKRLLLRVETADMMLHRAQLIAQTGRRDGAIGAPPDLVGGGGWTPGPGVGGGPGGPGMGPGGR